MAKKSKDPDLFRFENRVRGMSKNEKRLIGSFLVSAGFGVPSNDTQPERPDAIAQQLQLLQLEKAIRECEPVHDVVWDLWRNGIAWLDPDEARLLLGMTVHLFAQLQVLRDGLRDAMKFQQLEGRFGGRGESNEA